MKLVEMHVGCQCEGWVEMSLVSDSYHGEDKVFACPKCGHRITLEFSLVSEL